jgi:hypothetical protein
VARFDLNAHHGHAVVKSSAGVEYLIDRVNEHVFTVRWKAKGQENVRYASSLKNAQKVARGLADLSSALARRVRA